jgi:putative ATPase
MQDDLFAAERKERELAAAPLAARMRPRSLTEVVGQRNLLRRGAAFRSMVDEGRPVSMILWGPPGTGKTTLANLVAVEADAAFEQLSATSAGVKDVREVLSAARHRLETDGRRTVLFLDEIHRFTKAQQDALLPGVESGLVILVGATTENPFFEVNSPLISRCLLFRLERLEPPDVKELIRRALVLPHGLEGVQIEDEALEALGERTGGDARLALNALETAALVASGRSSDSIGPADVEEALQRRIIRYDKSGDQHYDIVSAFIKSMRGSDPDAALYWLHTMLGAGEDPEFIARRMIIFASEDVGLADPGALQVAVAGFQALQFVGLPEASFALSEVAVYLASAPKSNSITAAMGRARSVVEDTPSARVPAHLRDAHYSGARTLGHGEGYRYPHDYPGHIVEQQYLPDELSGTVLFRPGSEGAEPEIAERLAAWDRRLARPER